MRDTRYGWLLAYVLVMVSFPLWTSAMIPKFQMARITTLKQGTTNQNWTPKGSAMEKKKLEAEKSKAGGSKIGSSKAGTSKAETSKAGTSKAGALEAGSSDPNPVRAYAAELTFDFTRFENPQDQFSILANMASIGMQQVWNLVINEMTANKEVVSDKEKEDASKAFRPKMVAALVMDVTNPAAKVYIASSVKGLLSKAPGLPYGGAHNIEPPIHPALKSLFEECMGVALEQKKAEKAIEAEEITKKRQGAGKEKVSPKPFSEASPQLVHMNDLGCAEVLAFNSWINDFEEKEVDPKKKIKTADDLRNIVQNPPYKSNKRMLAISMGHRITDQPEITSPCSPTDKPESKSKPKQVWGCNFWLTQGGFDECEIGYDPLNLPEGATEVKVRPLEDIFAKADINEGEIIETPAKGAGRGEDDKSATSSVKKGKNRAQSPINQKDTSKKRFEGSFGWINKCAAFLGIKKNPKDKAQGKSKATKSGSKFKITRKPTKDATSKKKTMQQEERKMKLRRRSRIQRKTRTGMTVSPK